MFEYLINGDTLSAWANHARRLSNTSDPLNCAEIAEIISRTVGTLNTSGDYEVRVLDQGGIVEESGMYKTGEVFAVPESSHDIFDIFNGTFDTIAEFDTWTATAPINSNSFVTVNTIPIDIGPLYKPVDDCINISINVEDNTTITLTIINPDIIDWGDGTTDNISGNVNIHSHTYISSGRYLIKIPRDSDSELSITQSIGYDDVSKKAIHGICIPKWLSDTKNGLYSGLNNLPNLEYVLFENGIKPVYNKYSNTYKITTLSNSKSLKYVHLPKSILGPLNTLPDDFLYESGISGITLPYGIISIPKNCFHECTNLENIIIPDSVTSIGKWAFNGCLSLKKVILSKNTTIIKEATFFDCKSLSEIVGIDNITTIERYAFSSNGDYNYLIKKLILPSVVFLGSRALSGLMSLKTLILSANSVCELEIDENDGTDGLSDTFFDQYRNKPDVSYYFIYVPDNLVSSYKADTNWSKYSKLIKPLSEYVETTDNSGEVTS